MDLKPWLAQYRRMLCLLPSGFRRYRNSIPYFTGYSSGVLYDWDQYFDAIVLLYCGFSTQYVRNGVRIFLARQDEDGFIPRSIPEDGGPTHHKHLVHFKPFLAQQVLLCRQADGEMPWLSQDDYQRLCKYLLYWLNNRDVRGAGLSVWQDAGHSGMDNHTERAGTWDGDNSYCEGVDLNCYLVRECRAMATLADLLDRKDDAAMFAELAERRIAAIRQWLWSEQEGIFYDYDARRNKPIPVKHVGIFSALWANVATRDQADRLVREHLLNEQEFWRAYPLAALAATEPGYVQGYLPGHSTTCSSWRAHTWIPTNYYAMHGLRACGYADTAATLAQRTWQMFLRGPFSEYYTSDSGIGTGLKPFWGWSCLAVFMERELELGIDPTQLDPNNPAIHKMRRWLISHG